MQRSTCSAGNIRVTNTWKSTLLHIRIANHNTHTDTKILYITQGCTLCTNLFNQPCKKLQKMHTRKPHACLITGTCKHAHAGYWHKHLQASFRVRLACMTTSMAITTLLYGDCKGSSYEFDRFPSRFPVFFNMITFPVFF